ncbi:MAG: alpha/beta hydrolase [Woeseia sp.]
MRSALLSLLAIATAAYLCLGALLYLFQRSFIYFPTPAPPAGNVLAEELWLSSGKEQLRIWLLHGDRPDAIVYFGGNAENVALNVPDYGRIFPDRAVYLVNYRGYGGSTGTPGEDALYSDAEAVFDFVNERHRSVSLVGRSLGASIVTWLACAASPARLVLITPFDSLASLARRLYPIFPASLLLREQHDSISRAGCIDTPVLVLVAGRDEIVPRENSRKLAEAIRNDLVTLRVIDGTTHNTIESAPEFYRVLEGFLSDGARSPGAMTP